MKIKLEKQARISVVVTVLVVLFLVGSVLAQTRTYDQSDVDLLVKGMSGQVDILKWIGVPVVVGLCAAVSFLIRALLKSNEILVNEVKGGAEARRVDSLDRAKAHEEMTDCLRELSAEVREIQFRLPCAGSKKSIETASQSGQPELGSDLRR
jgi:uncharacterized protein involved in cysteine biosynthesis